MRSKCYGKAKPTRSNKFPCKAKENLKMKIFFYIPDLKACDILTFLSNVFFFLLFILVDYYRQCCCFFIKRRIASEQDKESRLLVIALLVVGSRSVQLMAW